MCLFESVYGQLQHTRSSNRTETTAAGTPEANKHTHTHNRQTHLVQLCFVAEKVRGAAKRLPGHQPRAAADEAPPRLQALVKADALAVGPAKHRVGPHVGTGAVQDGPGAVLGLGGVLAFRGDALAACLEVGV